MRHLPLLPVFCATLAACAAPATPRPGGTFTLEPGASVEVAPGTILSFEAADDSRCPPGMRCVRAGTLACRFVIRRGADAPETFTLSPEQAAATSRTLGGKRILLDRQTIPAPPAPGTAITYRATISISPP